MKNENSPLDDKNNENETHEELINDSMLEEQWANLSQDWQNQEIPKTDINALVKQTRRRTYWAKFCFILNIIATIGLIVFFAYGVFEGQLGDPVNTYVGLGGLLAAIFLYLETKLRLKTWRQLCDSPEKAIENAIKACESSMSYMFLTKLSFIPFLFLVNWFVYTMAKTSDKAVLPAYLAANGFMFLMYLIVEFLHRKRKKEYQQLLTMKDK